MEIKRSDLIVDELGNYYVIDSEEDGKLTIVHAIVHHAYRRLLSHEFVDEVTDKYGKQVAVCHYFQDALVDRIEGIKSGKYPGNIYRLDEVRQKYQVYLDVFYERTL